MSTPCKDAPFRAWPRPARLAWRVIYGLYAWIVFVVLASSAVCITALLPGVHRRRLAAHAVSGALLKLAGMRLTVKSAQQIPTGQCVIVANHASYLDGVVFTAVLPPRFGFVIKREMARVPLAGLLLRRLGSLFVERSNRQRGASDARRVLRTAINGSSLMFFPEGTFSPTPGLLKFHVGAFTTAARVGCPVVPAVVRGTRGVLPQGAFFPRRAPIEVEFLPALVASADAGAGAAVELRDRARAAILARLQEPDLAAA
jgi:1-acyl-sn-glycerol-3-phosphate acyltransferase